MGGEEFVWLNPPYPNIGAWLAKLAGHPAGGIALVFARTDTRAFQQYVFPAAHSLFFIAGRLKFHHHTGTQARENAGAPSVLIAYGAKATTRIQAAHHAGAITGHHTHLTPPN